MKPSWKHGWKDSMSWALRLYRAERRRERTKKIQKALEMRKKGMKIEDIARRMGIKPRTIMKYVYGK